MYVCMYIYIYMYICVYIYIYIYIIPPRAMLWATFWADIGGGVQAAKALPTSISTLM